MKIIRTPQYKRNLKKLKEKGLVTKDEITQVYKNLTSEAFDENFRLHNLTRKYQRYFSLTVNHRGIRILLVLKPEDKKAIFTDIDTHDQIYKGSY